MAESPTHSEGTLGNLDKFDRIVVLMLENRSLDTMLGYLYENDTPDNLLGAELPSGEAFDGVVGKNLTNPGPDGQLVALQKAPFASQREMCNPFPDPGEELSPHINRQLYGKIDPDPADLQAPAPMNGFVIDYAAEILRQSVTNIPASEAEYRLIMNAFTPDALPVLNGLAKAFAVSDRWFCSVPSQTFCNRSFIHSAQSNGYVTNSNYVKWIDNTAPTIFNRLSDQNLGWRVYFDRDDVASATRSIHPSLHSSLFDVNFSPFDTFCDDCAAGTLPEYCFIEPRLFFNHNDQHPPSVINMLVDSSMLAGEVLIEEVYSAIVANPKLAERTLLIVLYDEHGGCYDHVPPPTGMKAPIVGGKHEAGFAFDRLGVRVPAVFISPYVDAKTVVRALGDTPFDHTSIIKTICEKWGLPSLTARDQAAPSLAHLLTRDTPRTDLPSFTARPYEKTPVDVAKLFPISPHQEHVLGVISQALGTTVPADVKTLGQAIAHLSSAVTGGWGKKT
jgi:phospholipase C